MLKAFLLINILVSKYTCMLVSKYDSINVSLYLRVQIKEGNQMSNIITFGNFKGGTGKTTNATLTGLALARANKKTLLIDFDPQANATDIYFKTAANLDKGDLKFRQTLLSAVEDSNVQNAILNLDENIDFIPSSADFSLYPRYLEKEFKDNYLDRVTYFSKLMESFKNKYDYILFDLPPTISLISDSALYASDWVLIILQTQEHSLQGAESFLKYIQDQVINKYQAPNLNLLGILPVLLKNGAPVDKSTLEIAIEEFGEENMFNTLIRSMERIKRYSIRGIYRKDQYDKKIIRLYDKVAKEIIERAGTYESTNQ